MGNKPSNQQQFNNNHYNNHYNSLQTDNNNTDTQSIDDNTSNYYNNDDNYPPSPIKQINSISSSNSINEIFLQNETLQKFKILLLGIGSSGKSTFFKQIEHFKIGKNYKDLNIKKGIIYFNIIKDIGICCKEYFEFLNLINEYSENTLQNTLQNDTQQQVDNNLQNFTQNLNESDKIINIYKNYLNIPIEIKESMKRMINLSTSKKFLSSSISRSSSKNYNPTFDEHFSEQVITDIENIWKYLPFKEFVNLHIYFTQMPFDNTLQNTLQNNTQNTQQQIDNTLISKLRNNDFDDLIYFLNNRLQNIYPPYQYEPNMKDILNRRVKTTGMYFIHFVMDVIKNNEERETRNYLFLDSGGQRNERKKWNQVYENTFSILYFVSLSDINLTLYEDINENRLFESLKVFEQICNEELLLKNVPIVLIFTKIDIFKEKIKFGLNPIEFFERILREKNFNVVDNNTLQNNTTNIVDSNEKKEIDMINNNSDVYEKISSSPIKEEKDIATIASDNFNSTVVVDPPLNTETKDTTTTTIFDNNNNKNEMNNHHDNNIHPTTSETTNSKTTTTTIEELHNKERTSEQVEEIYQQSLTYFTNLFTTVANNNSNHHYNNNSYISNNHSITTFALNILNDEECHPIFENLLKELNKRTI
ncbi:hypothetical protein ABK040_011569 [Willaertia magna]